MSANYILEHLAVGNPVDAQCAHEHFDAFLNVAAEVGYDSTVAPLTFLAVAGRRVQMDVFTKFDIPINMARVLHRDQKFLYHRPIKAGDRLYFDTYLDSVIESHGTVIAEIRSEVTDADGNPIITSIVTMLGESSNPDANAEATIAAIASIRAGA